MKKAANILIFIFLILTVISCSGNKKSATESSASSATDVPEDKIIVTKSQFESSGMQIGKLSEFEFTDVIHANGYINVPPQKRAKISTLAAGYIKNNPLIEGDKVKKGQVLLTLVNPDYLQMQQDYIESWQQMKYQEAEYLRQKSLSAENIASQKIFMKAEGDFLSAKAKYEALKQKLILINIDPANVENGVMVSEISIYSPLDGYITSQNTTQGMFITPSDVVIEIVDPEHFHLELSVFEKDVLKIKEGQEILFRIPEADQTLYKGEVILVGKSVEGEERAVKIHGHLNDKRKINFVTGMFIEADILIGKRESHGLPSEAVNVMGNDHFIFVKTSEDGDKMYFTRKKVEIGQVSENLTEIIGDHDTSNILIKGAFNLRGNN